MYIISEVFALIGGANDNTKIIISVFIFVLYDPLFTTIYGGTIGHTLTNISVRKAKNINKNIALSLAIIRFLLKVTLGWLSLITIGASEKKTAIHDKAANSVVIKR